MKSEWSSYKLGEIVTVLSGGTPSTKVDKYFEGDIPWITPKDLSNYVYRYISKGERSISDQGLENSSAKIVPKGTVLFSSRAPIGYVAIAETELTTNQGFKNFICNQKYLDNEYLYYYLLNNVEMIKDMANGSIFKEISAGVAKKIPITIPSLNTQKKIVSILGVIDQKYELNLKMIDNLIKLSSEIYKEFFRKDADKNVLADGWFYSTIGEEVSILGGGTPNTERQEYWVNGEINWFTPSDITSNKSSFITDSVKKITPRAIEKSSAKIFPPYSLMVTSRATIGNIAINTKPSSTNQGFIVLIPNQIFSVYFLYFWIQQNLSQIHSLSNGSTFKEISKSNFKTIKLLRTNDITIYSRFNDLVKPNFDRIEQLTIENNNLLETKSHLIPYLLDPLTSPF